MAGAFYSQFPEKKQTVKTKPYPPGMGGAPGAEASKKKPTERTAAWPTPGPVWKGSFNSKVGAHVVKTTAKRHGITA